MSQNDQNKPPAPAAGDGDKTKMVANTKKLVRIRALRDFNLSSSKREDGPTGQEGGEYEVSEEDAALLCKPIPGNYNFAGERIDEEATRGQVVRAVRI